MVNDNPMWQAINDAYAAIANLPPRPERIYLTDEQIAACPRVVDTATVDPLVHFTSIPVERVETVEESTPYRLVVESAERDGYRVVSFDGKLYALKPPEPFVDR